MNRVASRRTCRPKIQVEFLGASGIGKSYLIGKLVEELESRNIAVTNLDDARLNKASLRAFQKMLRIAWVTLHIRPHDLHVYLKTVRLLARISLAPRDSRQVAGVFVRSEGVFHNLRTIARRSRLRDMYEIASRLLPAVFLPDMIVILEASAQRIYDQRVSRGRQGDVFTLNSVEIDCCTTHESIKLVDLFRRRHYPGMQIVRCNLDQLTTRDAVNRIATIIEDAVSNS
jgi:GTPase SAR1 family protein